MRAKLINNATKSVVATFIAEQVNMKAYSANFEQYIASGGISAVLRTGAFLPVASNKLAFNYNIEFGGQSYKIIDVKVQPKQLGARRIKEFLLQ
jgi:hypothetical protein